MIKYFLIWTFNSVYHWNSFPLGLLQQNFRSGNFSREMAITTQFPLTQNTIAIILPWVELFIESG